MLIKGQSMKHPDFSDKSSQQGVVLIEALIAILIFSMGVLAIVGLQAAMIKNASDSKFRADASFIAQQRIGMMWADPDNIGTYLENATPLTNVLPNGTRTVVQPDVAIPEYVVTITWQLPGESAHTYVTTAVIVGG